MSVLDCAVVGIDGTDFGFEALHQTLALCPAGSTVCAVTALDTSIAVHGGFTMGDVSAQLAEEADRARARAAEIVDGRDGCSAKIVRGDAKRVLRQVCVETDATLLALGGRSRSRFLGLLAGETAGSLLHEASRSVLLARPRWGHRWHPGRIVVGLDGSEPSLAALSLADDLAGRLGSELLVAAATGGKPVRREEAWAERVTEWDPGHPVALLRDRSRRADLVLLGSRGLHGLRTLGSVSERVAHQAHCSVLVVHLPQADVSG